MKTIKQITAIFLLLVGLLIVSSAALAVTENMFKVEVDDEVLTEGGDTFYAERGEEITVETSFKYDTKLDDVKVKTWLGGYEYDDVEAVTEIFDYTTAGMVMKKTLKIQLPEDMDASEEYFLHVELYNPDYVSQHKYKLMVEESRHKLSIQDVILKPNTVTAGNALFATVRVENLGDKKEEDVKVTVSIPDLGVSAREYIDELGSKEDDDDDDEPETSGSTSEMKLPIPTDAKTGDYNVEVTVSYSRGHETLKKTEIVHVKAAEAVVTEEIPKTLVSVDGTAKEAVAGIEVPYKVMVANLGKETSVYSVEVAGADLWALVRVEPAMVTLTPDATGEMYVYVKPKADVESGKKTFTFKVKSGNTIGAEKTLTTDVKGKTGTSATGATTATNGNGQTNFGSLKNALIIGFGVLVVLLVILGLIIAFNKMSKDEEEEMPTTEGQAYY